MGIDTLAMGRLPRPMGRFIGPREGSIAITLFDMAITEHAEKYAAFENTLRSFYPGLHALKPIEDHDVEAEAYRKCCKLFEKIRTCLGFVSTEASIPVLKAARDAVAGPADRDHDRSVSGTGAADSVVCGGGVVLPGSAGSGTDGIPHVARILVECQPTASGCVGSPPGDAEPGLLPTADPGISHKQKKTSRARNPAPNWRGLHQSTNALPLIERENLEEETSHIWNDVGTGGTRAGSDAAGQDRFRSRTTSRSIARAWLAEQDPRDWWRASGGAVKRAPIFGELERERHCLCWVLRADAWRRPYSTPPIKSYATQSSGAIMERGANPRTREAVWPGRADSVTCNPPLTSEFHADEAAAGCARTNLVRVAHVMLPVDYVRSG